MSMHSRDECSQWYHFRRIRFLSYPVFLGPMPSDCVHFFGVFLIERLTKTKRIIKFSKRDADDCPECRRVNRSRDGLATFFHGIVGICHVRTTRQASENRQFENKFFENKSFPRHSSSTAVILSSGCIRYAKYYYNNIVLLYINRHSESGVTAGENIPVIL